MEQRGRAVCIERCKHGFGRGLRRPTIEMWQGGAFLLYVRPDRTEVEVEERRTEKGPTP